MTGPGTGAHQAAAATWATRLYCAALFLVPSYAVLAPVGASGHLAGLIGMSLALAWGALTLLGLHPAHLHAHPARRALAVLWVVSTASYASLLQRPLEWASLSPAERWFLQLAVITGVAALLAEMLHDPDGLRVALRALSYAAAGCGAVAALQYVGDLDLSRYLAQVPGLTDRGGGGVLSRNTLNRVSGTARHPIELGVVMGMLLPLVVHSGLHDRQRHWALRLTPVLLVGFAVPSSLSRSAILAAAVSMAVYIALLPPLQRLVALGLAPLGIVIVFATSPGVVSTLTSFFRAAPSDPSVITRLSDYPLAEGLAFEHPWLGRGGGTYIAPDAIAIFDNQYLQTLVELGVLGVLALLLLLAAPVVAATHVYRRVVDPEGRSVAGAVAGAGSAALLTSATFDSFGFPMFVGAFSFVVGISGLVWQVTSSERLAYRERMRSASHPPLQEAGH